MYKIKKASVIGAGTMGLGIAGQLANAGIDVLLLDLASDGENRNAIGERAVERLLDEQQPGLLHRDYLRHITIGNIEDDLSKIKDADWITEAVVEKLEIKKTLYKKIDSFRKPKSIVSSNTSTIPISLLVEDMPESFKSEFAITHFFNPVRFMRLLEIVKGKSTKEEVIKSLQTFNDEKMGKGIVLCNDTPGFLGNRIGVFAIQTALHQAFKLDLNPEEADSIFGRPMGIPKTGVFGLYDLIGIDLMSDVAQSLINILPKDDVFHDVSKEIPIMRRMIDEGRIGNKGGKGGFYNYRVSGDNSSKQTLEFTNFTYRDFDRGKPRIAIEAEEKDDFTLMLEGTDKFSIYAWKIISNTLCYAAFLVPKVNESIVSIDDAMKLGYNWTRGPFEMLDTIGVDKFIKRLRDEKKDIPPFLEKAAGKTFYRTFDNNLEYLLAEGNYVPIRHNYGIRRFTEERKILQPIAENASASYFDIGHDIGMVEFHSKANTLDSFSMNLLEKAVSHAVHNFRGLIIHNDSPHFSCGVNLQSILQYIEDLDWAGLDAFLEHFQRTVKSMKYAPIPIVAAPVGLSIGGGYEVVLHSDKAIYHSNSVTGLVESLVGLVPGGGGVKEMLYRWNEKINDEKKAAWETFMNIGYGKTARSPVEGEAMAMFIDRTDEYVMNRDRILDTAVKATKKLSENYQIQHRSDLKMTGRDVWKDMKVWLKQAHDKGHLTPHDVTTGAQIAMIVTGGDVNSGELFSEDQLFSLERKAFINLAQTDETRKRIKHMLDFGVPLRN